MNRSEIIPAAALLETGHPIYIISDGPRWKLGYDDADVPYLPNIYLDTVIVLLLPQKSIPARGTDWLHL